MAASHFDVIEVSAQQSLEGSVMRGNVAAGAGRNCAPAASNLPGPSTSPLDVGL